MDRLVTIRDAGRWLTISRSTLWRLVRDQELAQPIRITEARRAFRERDLQDFIDRRAAGSR